jgi:hypothetical protein
VGIIRYSIKIFVFPSYEELFETSYSPYAFRLATFRSKINEENQKIFDQAGNIDFTEEQWQKVQEYLELYDFDVDIVTDVITQKIFRNDLAAFDRCCAPLVRKYREFRQEIPKANFIPETFDCHEVRWAATAYTFAKKMLEDWSL